MENCIQFVLSLVSLPADGCLMYLLQDEENEVQEFFSQFLFIVFIATCEIDLCA